MAKTFNTIKTESSTNVWLTPRNVLDLLGDFDTDPCAATIRPWDCARVNYTVEDNGLILPWKGRVWLNPPYGNVSIHALVRVRPLSRTSLLMVTPFQSTHS